MTPSPGHLLPQEPSVDGVLVHSRSPRAEVDQPTEQRARAIVLYDKNRDALGLTESVLRDEKFSKMGDLPETQAGLRLALAELYTNDGDTSRALVEIDKAESLDTPDDLQIESWRPCPAGSHGGYQRRNCDLASCHRVKSDDGKILPRPRRLLIEDLHLRAGRTSRRRSIHNKS